MFGEGGRESSPLIKEGLAKPKGENRNSAKRKTLD